MTPGAPDVLKRFCFYDGIGIRDTSFRPIFKIQSVLCMFQVGWFPFCSENRDESAPQALLRTVTEAATMWFCTSLSEIFCVRA